MLTEIIVQTSRLARASWTWQFREDFKSENFAATRISADLIASVNSHGLSMTRYAWDVDLFLSAYSE